MYRDRNFFITSLLCVVIIPLLTGWVESAHSQGKYPTRVIELVVPYAPGGAADLVTRLTAAHLKTKWGVPVNVVNKTGGNTVPASLEVYSEKPDGYTLLGDSTGSSSMLPIAVRNLPFKIMDRVFVGTTAFVPCVFVVPASSQVNNLKDLEAEVKKNPENFTWASNAGAGIGDFATRQFLKKIGVDISKTKPINAKGGAESVVLTAGGNTKLGTATTSATLPSIKGGLTKGIAITSKNRWPDLPSVPTTVEQGYPTITASSYYGISGPPNLPSHIVEIWNKALQEMVKDPEFMAQMKNIGAVPSYLNAHDTKEYVIRETEEVRVLWGL